MKIVDDFLDQKEFDNLQAFMMGLKFSWNYNSTIDYSDDLNKFQFIHLFYDLGSPRSPLGDKLNSILQKIQPTAVIRIKANLLTRTPKIVENDYHVDISNYDDENRKTIFLEKLKQLTTSIFYLNTNNGYTKFEDGTKVESVANRMVSFSADMKHFGTSCTDENTRIVINFNYFK